MPKDKLTALSKAEGRVCPYNCHFMWKPEGFRYIRGLTLTLYYPTDPFQGQGEGISAPSLEQRRLTAKIFS
mgnify:CR=1 FL=1